MDIVARLTPQELSHLIQHYKTEAERWTTTDEPHLVAAALARKAYFEELAK